MFGFKKTTHYKALMASKFYKDITMFHSLMNTSKGSFKVVHHFELFYLCLNNFVIFYKMATSLHVWRNWQGHEYSYSSFGWWCTCIARLTFDIFVVIRYATIERYFNSYSLSSSQKRIGFCEWNKLMELLCTLLLFTKKKLFFGLNYL
jgi:hypothetical protein